MRFATPIGASNCQDICVNKPEASHQLDCFRLLSSLYLATISGNLLIYLTHGELVQTLTFGVSASQFQGFT